MHDPASAGSNTAPVLDSTTNELSEAELLKLENTRLKQALQLLESKDQELRALAEDCKGKEIHRDRCKDVLKKANEELILSLEALAELASGTVTVTVDFSKKVGDGETCAEPVKDDAVDGKPKKKKGAKVELSAGTDHRQVAGVARAWTHAISRTHLEKCDCAALVTGVAEASKRKVGAVKAMADALYAPAYQHCFEDESGYCDAWPLLDISEWEARLAETYGPACYDLDDDKEAEAMRRKGGEYCGLVVKNGRRKYVVGPDSEVIRLVYGVEGKNVADDCIAAQMLTEKKKGKA